MIDDTMEVREDEKLDTQVLAEFLKDKLPGAEDPKTLEIRQFGGGAANLTYHLSYPNYEYVLRRPPLGKVAKSSHDMGREYKVLSKLHEKFPYAPRAYLLHDDPNLIGGPFFIMERKKGIVIRRKIPDSLKDNPEIGISICKAMIEGLADFHSVDYSELGLQDLGKPEGFIERQIEGWYHRWSGAKLKESSKMDEIYNWLSKNIPHEDIHYSLVHNDYKLDNVMLNAADPSKLVAVFDWDMCTLGDSLSDLGALLAYWYEPTDPPYLKGMSMMPTEGMNFMTRSELVNYYEQCIGRKISNINFYHCLGLFRVVVIIAQIYYRFVKKQTQDQRFEAFGAIIPIVIKAAYDLIEKH